MCDKRFIWNCDLLRHVATHSTERAHVCAECGTAFKLAEGLKKHKMLHSENSAKCTECSRTYKTKESLRLHSCQRNSSRCRKGSFPCTTCGKVFNRKDLLLVHSRIHTGELPYVCVVCDKGFVTASKCSVHLATHRSKPYVCTDCKKCFASPVALQAHLDVDDDTWTHSLALTDVQLTRCNKGGVVLVHIDIVFEQCDEVTTPILMSRQIPAVTIATFPAPLLPPPCPFCSDGCYDTDGCHDADGLADHMLLHMSPVPYRCSSCKQGFEQGTELDAHECTAPSSSTYDCEHCADSFTNYCDWTKHNAVAHSVKVRKKKPLIDKQAAVKIATPTGNERYECTSCDKSFSLLPSLRTHMHMHTGRYQCSNCDRRFATATKLKAHMFIHTGERPFKCDECDRSFKCSTDRRRHMEETHLGVRHHCEQCNKDFKRAAFLSHKRRAHQPPLAVGDTPLLLDSATIPLHDPRGDTPLLLDSATIPLHDPAAEHGEPLPGATIQAEQEEPVEHGEPVVSPAPGDTITAILTKLLSQQGQQIN